MKTFAIAAVLGLGVMAAPASAATILEYETDASTANATLFASDTGTGVTAAEMSAGPGLTANAGGTWNWRDWTGALGAFGDAQSAIDDGNWWSWGFSSTEAWDLTAFDIRVDRSSTGPNAFEIFVAVGLTPFTSVLTYDFGDAASGVNFFDVDLSAYTAVTDVTFLLTAWGADSGGASSAGTFDLETVSGESYGFQLRGDLTPTAPVPLPAGLPLVLTGLGALGLVARRRRKN